jgi:hypothetical protein
MNQISLVLVSLVLVACGPAHEPVPCQPISATSWPGPDNFTDELPGFPRREDFSFVRRWATSFEAVEDLRDPVRGDFYLTPQGHLETSWHELSGAQAHSGGLAHRAWFRGTNQVLANSNTNHRAYPTIQLFKRDGAYAGLVRVELWVWLDAEARDCREESWFSLATLTSYADDYWANSQLVNVDAQGFVHLMHVPSLGQRVHDIFQTNSVRLPLRQWVKLTVLLDYGAANPWSHPYLAVWQDEQLVSAARFEPRIEPSAIAAVPRAQWPRCLSAWDGISVEGAEAACGLNFRSGSLAQAHFGLYAPPRMYSGQVFNDDLEILEAAP